MEIFSNESYTSAMTTDILNSSFLISNETIPKNETFPEKHAYPREVTIFAAVCAILFCIIGISGNLITIIALYKNRKLRITPTTWFVLNLCISDLIFCTINLPLTATRYIYEEWIFGEGLCVVFPFFFYSNMATSLLNMVAISVNRYILISHYSKYDQIFNRRNLICMIISVWAFSFFMLSFPLFKIWGEFGLDNKSFSCTILKRNEKSPKKFLFVFGILIPCIIIIFSYTSIWFKVRKSRKNLLGHNQRSDNSATKNGSLVNGNTTLKDKKKSNKNSKRDDIQLTKMMLIIFITFICSFIPLMIFNVADDNVRVPTLHVLASILAWASSVINPIIYAGTNLQYRKAYFELFSLCGLGRKDKNLRFVGRRQTQVTNTNVSGSGRTQTLTTEMVQINGVNGNGVSNSISKS